MFPAGVAGAALILLRVSVVATLMVDGAAHRSLLLSFWSALLYLLPALCLIVGFLTPYSAIVCCIIQLAELVTGGTNEFHLAVSILNAAILAVLGPVPIPSMPAFSVAAFWTSLPAVTHKRLPDPDTHLFALRASSSVRGSVFRLDGRRSGAPPNGTNRWLKTSSNGAVAATCNTSHCWQWRCCRGLQANAKGERPCTLHCETLILLL